MAFFVNLGGSGRACWVNIDQIVRIEPAVHHGVPDTTPSKGVWAVTLVDGSYRGITDDEFRRIMRIGNAPNH